MKETSWSPLIDFDPAPIISVPFYQRADVTPAELAKLRDENERMETALHRISDWSKAYPLDVFPEPDFKRARQLLEAGGITLDCVSASNMRHVVEGVGKIADEALKGENHERH